MSRCVLTDADFLGDRHTVLSDAIKWTHVSVNQRRKNIAFNIVFQKIRLSGTLVQAGMNKVFPLGFIWYYFPCRYCKEKAFLVRDFVSSLFRDVTQRILVVADV